MTKINQDGGVVLVAVIIILTGIALGQFYITHPQIFKSNAASESNPQPTEVPSAEYNPEPDIDPALRTPWPSPKDHYFLISTPTPSPTPKVVPTSKPSQAKPISTKLPTPTSTPYATPYGQPNVVQYSTEEINTSSPNPIPYALPTALPYPYYDYSYPEPQYYNLPVPSPSTTPEYSVVTPVSPLPQPTVIALPVQDEQKTFSTNGFIDQAKRFLFGE